MVSALPLTVDNWMDILNCLNYLLSLGGTKIARWGEGTKDCTSPVRPSIHHNHNSYHILLSNNFSKDI